MLTSEFDFNLPKELIAQEAPLDRSSSKLLVIKKSSSALSGTHDSNDKTSMQAHDNKNDFVITQFKNILEYIAEGDVLVLNDSKVFKARFFLHKESVKNKCLDNNNHNPTSRIEICLAKQMNPDNLLHWQAFAKPGKKLRAGDEFNIGKGAKVIIIAKKIGMVEILFDLNGFYTSVFDLLDEVGFIPLPPYIKRDLKNALDTSNDNERYQTVYSKNIGSVAAPTAGLHFTTELIDAIRKKGAEVVFVTLHVGAGTFLPIKTDNIFDHNMHSEYYYIDEDTANKINIAKINKRRIIAVGTTSMRTLEASAIDNKITNKQGETNLFIAPGFKFQIVDALISNFHLPKSSLFVLFCAFVGKAKACAAYEYAISHKMRFFSYGDATFSYLNS